MFLWLFFPLLNNRGLSYQNWGRGGRVDVLGPATDQWVMGALASPPPSHWGPGTLPLQELPGEWEVCREGYW